MNDLEMTIHTVLCDRADSDAQEKSLFWLTRVAVSGVIRPRCGAVE